MTKLFVQMLLSVIVGVSAALSISPKVQADLKENLLQASASLQETAKVAIENAKIKTTVSLKTDVKLSPDSNEQVELKLKNNVNAKLSNDNLLSGSSVDNTINHELRTDLEPETSSLNIELKEKGNSAFDLDLGSGK
jgi:hypothetical protein